MVLFSILVGDADMIDRRRLPVTSHVKERVSMIEEKKN